MNSHGILLYITSACALFVASSSLYADEYTLREAAECRVRDGLPNLFAKIKSANGKEIRIAYLGGSITAAPGWRVKTLAWLQEQFPEVKFSEIHAAIGGTGSDLGVFRLEQDALRHKPDLLLVEFAVNDGGAPPERIHQAMEGIIRQTWKANPEMDICFVYTLSLPMLDLMKAGKCWRSASAMEELADFYQIPSIHFGVEVAKLEKERKLIFKGEKNPDNQSKYSDPMLFSTDGVHPLVETGHELYTQAFARSFKQIQQAEAKPALHKLDAPMREDNWEQAKLVPLGSVKLAGDWSVLDSGSHTIAKRFAKFMPEMRMASKPGASLSFRFKGSFVGIYDLLGPDCGQVRASVDGGEGKSIKRVDGYCTYTRLSKMTLGSGLDPNAEHSIKVTLDSEVPDKRDVLFERNRADYDKNPKKYEGTNWYVGSVMLIGELLE